MAEISSYWEQNYQHVGKCIAGHHIIMPLVHRSSFGRSHRGCAASQRVAGPYSEILHSYILTYIKLYIYIYIYIYIHKLYLKVHLRREPHTLNYAYDLAKNTRNHRSASGLTIKTRSCSNFRDK